MIIDCWKSLATWKRYLQEDGHAGMTYPNFTNIVYTFYTQDSIGCGWFKLPLLTSLTSKLQDRYIYKAVEEARLPGSQLFPEGFSQLWMFGKACGQLLSMLEPPPQDMQEYMDSTESTGPDGGELSWVDNHCEKMKLANGFKILWSHQSSRHHRCLGSRD